MPFELLRPTMNLGKILIRADANAEIGTGHVMRCLALAQAWQDAGGSAVFFMAETTPAISARLTAERCIVEVVPVIRGSLEDAELVRKTARKYRADWVVIDGYKFGEEYQTRIRCDGNELLCIDDYGGSSQYSADIILNQNVTADDSWYGARCQNTKLLLGPRYCLLRREFAPWREWKRKISVVGRSVLLSLGGSTSAEVAVRVMESLDRVTVDGLQVLFAIGGSSENVGMLKRSAARFASKITTQVDVSDMAQLISSADIAVSAAGSTCWELCHLGLPAVLLDLAANQTPVASELQRQGCALYAGNAQSFDPAELTNTVQELLMSQKLRTTLSQRSRKLVDGLGAERVISAMLQARREPVLEATRGARI